MSEEDEPRDRPLDYRRRLFELHCWFRADMNRLADAQAAWRRDELWARRRRQEVERLIDGGPATTVAPASAAAALFELEALDEAAWVQSPDAGPPRPWNDGERSWHVVRLARRRTPLAAHQVGLLSTHLRYHAVIPTRVTAIGGGTFDVRIEPFTSRRCRAAMRRGTVSVATTSFGDGASIDWAGSPSIAASIPTAAARANLLAKALRAAAGADVDVFVAPELTLPPRERDHLLAELRRGLGAPQVAMAVLGSFHESRRDLEGVERTFNVALLVDGTGNRIHEHRKLVAYGEHGPDEPRETIGVGNTITLVQTPLGLVAVAICKDFCDVHVERIWCELQPEWILVPAYGDGESAHHRAARSAALVSGSVTVVAHEAAGSVPTESGCFVFDRQRVDTHARAPAFKSHPIEMTKQ